MLGFGQPIYPETGSNLIVTSMGGTITFVSSYLAVDEHPCTKLAKLANHHLNRDLETAPQQQLSSNSSPGPTGRPAAVSAHNKTVQEIRLSFRRLEVMYRGCQIVNRIFY